MSELIRDRFMANLRRVPNLITLSLPAQLLNSISNEEWAGDLLRMAVVLLHASQEDLLRALAEIRLPDADPKHWVELDIQFYDQNQRRRPKITLVELHDHQSLSVKEFISKNIAAYLEIRTFNNVPELITILRCISIPTTLLDSGTKESLASLIKRRHLIVHRGDRQLNSGGTIINGAVELTTIDHLTVLDWFLSVAKLGRSLFGHLDIQIPSGDAAWLDAIEDMRNKMTKEGTAGS